MKVPARRRGNDFAKDFKPGTTSASMKVPARRRGNPTGSEFIKEHPASLNESPRPKAGKYGGVLLI